MPRLFALQRPLPAWPALAWLSLLLLVLCLMPARAVHAAEDPPARAGRVAEISGEAWLFDAENKEWLRVERNQTIGEGDRLRTDPRSRLTLGVGSTTLWLDEGADLELTRLDEGRMELHLSRGVLALRVRQQQVADDLQVFTEEGRFMPERPGLYRIDQLDRGSRAMAWQGRLRFESRAREAGAVWLERGEQAEFWWGNGPRTERQRIERDGFSDWLLAQRDADGEPQAYRYVSPEMTGAEVLDRYGRWETSPDYGALWIPVQVAPDWAPYRYGRWAWSSNWGWTWVDEAPWGFAPFHYGRWVQFRGRWCWAPGRYIARPVYAPALVAWVGGPSVSIGISIGGRPAPPAYGWYPLAPREVYVPSYRHSPSYWQRINHEHDPVTVRRPGEAPQRPHRNYEVPGAISILPAQGGRPMPLAPSQAMPYKPLPQAPGRADLPTPVGQERAARPERPGLPVRVDRPDRQDRQDRPESLTRPDRGEPQRPVPPAAIGGRGDAGVPQREREPREQRDPREPRSVAPVPLPERELAPRMVQPAPQQMPPQVPQQVQPDSRPQSLPQYQGLPTREAAPEPMRAPRPVYERMPERMPERPPQQAQDRGVERFEVRPPERQIERQMERLPERQPERVRELPQQRAREAELPQRQPAAEAPRAPAPRPERKERDEDKERRRSPGEPGGPARQ